MMARMKLGQIVATRGVVGLMRENNDFAAFVHRAFQRYLRADWGELCESDRRQNDRALAHGGDRILAAIGALALAAHRNMWRYCQCRYLGRL